MADFTAPAPREQTKTPWLHDRSRIPAAPDWSRLDLAKRWLPLLLGIAFALGAEALAFQTRASWLRHREWVVPVTTPLLVLGGIALGQLAARGRLDRVPWAIGFLFVAIVFTVFNTWRGSISSGHDTGRNIMTIVTAIMLALSVLLVVLTYIIGEVKDPTRPPASPPE